MISQKEVKIFEFRWRDELEPMHPSKDMVAITEPKETKSNHGLGMLVANGRGLTRGCSAVGTYSFRTEIEGLETWRTTGTMKMEAFKDNSSPSYNQSARRKDRKLWHQAPERPRNRN
jgi:hypothetical protein